MGRSERYNFDIGDNPGGNVGLIMSHIQPRSKVLECGCASGYMTRYLAEKKHCSVSIVEIDKECCEKAKQWAINWFNGDLEKENWQEYYQMDQFDYILFADVLEHLKDPLHTLKMSVNLLKDDGQVIICIPNICHNDIIVRMLHDHWNYTGMGLLDETHVHFWGVNELAPFVYNAGLAINSYEAVCIPTQQTEQRMPFKLDDEMIHLLKKRQYGEVYQWVITCSKRVD